MTTYLLATASVHVTAAAADYLGAHLDPAADHVVVVGVRDDVESDRDVADAVNVARSRLATVMPAIDLRDGAPVDEVIAAAGDHDPDVVLLGAHDGTPDSSGLGSTATALLSDLERPVVVSP